MSGFKLVFREHRENIQNIWDMAIKDLKKQYSGTAIGYVWSLLKNMIYVTAYWFAIAIGLRGAKDIGYPYMAWLVVGLGAWFFIKDTLAPAAKSIRSNKYLVTKMIYPISTIPTFKVVSSFISSLMFLPIIIIILLFSGVRVDIHWIQIFYYEFALLMLLIGISWLTSALVVMSRDIEMLISSTVFTLFWVTPILFPADNLKGALAVFMRLNPFYYAIEGFRATFLYGQWFWERPILTVYFWAVVIVMMVIGAFVHSKLRNQFVDVL